MIITVLHCIVCGTIYLKMSGFFRASVCVCQQWMSVWARVLFYQGLKGIFFSVPNMLLQTWFLLFCEAVKCALPSSDVLCFHTISCEKCAFSINIHFPREMYRLLNVYLHWSINYLRRKRVVCTSFFFFNLLSSPQTLASQSSSCGTSGSEHSLFSWASASASSTST